MDNSLAGSRHNIAAHYDIGNDLYTLMLDRWVGAGPVLSGGQFIFIIYI